MGQHADPDGRSAGHHDGQPGDRAEYAGLRSGSITSARPGAPPGCTFHYGRLDPRTISMITWAEAAAVSAAGTSLARCVLAVTGDVRTADVIDSAGRHFGKLTDTIPGSGH